MGSNLACIGLDVADQEGLTALIARTSRDSHRSDVAGGVTVNRWEDPSGAVLVINRRDGDLLGLLPTFGSGVGALVRDCRVFAGDLLTAEAVDADGQRICPLLLESPQFFRLAEQDRPWSGTAALTGLGVELALYADADDYAASPDSIVSEGDDARRWAPESLVCYGFFGEPEAATGHAHLSGTVLRAETRTNSLTGQKFVAAEVRTAGFEITICLPAADLPAVPQPGNVLAGTVFLIAELEMATA